MPTVPVSTITGQDTIAAPGTTETIFGVTAAGTQVALGQTTIQPNHLYGFTLSGVSYPSYIVSDTGPPPAVGGGVGKPVTVFVGANNTNTTTTAAGSLTAAEQTTTVKTNN